MYIKKSEVKKAAENYRISSDFYEALDGKVLELIENAKRRAMENNRKTLKGYDL